MLFVGFLTHGYKIERPVLLDDILHAVNGAIFPVRVAVGLRFLGGNIPSLLTVLSPFCRFDYNIYLI